MFLVRKIVDKGTTRALLVTYVVIVILLIAITFSIFFSIIGITFNYNITKVTFFERLLNIFRIIVNLELILFVCRYVKNTLYRL